MFMACYLSIKAFGKRDKGGGGSNPHSPYPLGQYSVCPLATVSSSLAGMKLKERDTLYMTSTPHSPSTTLFTSVPTASMQKKELSCETENQKKAAAANKTKDERQ